METRIQRSAGGPSDTAQASGKAPAAEQQMIAKASKPAREALRLHPLYHGKIQMLPKCPIRGLDDFAIWYTPGVAAACSAIQARPDLVYDYTNKANTIAIVTNGTRVLGLGDIGPEAGLPVMEGKALLFKYLGGVDAIPICLRARDPDLVVQVTTALEPSFGGINLEDIAQPDCFHILDALRSRMSIPVWHDDQQGSATVVLAGLRNALDIVGKRLDGVRIAMIGVGAANVATYRLLTAAGVPPGSIVACDSKGTLHSGRKDVEAEQVRFFDKWRICRESNGEGLVGGIAEALRGADVAIAFSASGPGIIDPAWLKGMRKDAILFACANPVPEVWPWAALEAGVRIVATGRSDFPNQVNNSLAFPGIFRGVLDVRARTVSEAMVIAAADTLAEAARASGLREDRILPGMDDWQVAARIAAATGVAAVREGLAAHPVDADGLFQSACQTISAAREATQVLMRAGLIAAPPEA